MTTPPQHAIANPTSKQRSFTFPSTRVGKEIAKSPSEASNHTPGTQQHSRTRQEKKKKKNTGRPTSRHCVSHMASFLPIAATARPFAYTRESFVGQGGRQFLPNRKSTIRAADYLETIARGGGLLPTRLPTRLEINTRMGQKYKHSFAVRTARAPGRTQKEPSLRRTRHLTNKA